jgi:hypothetical protein
MVRKIFFLIVMLIGTPALAQSPLPQFVQGLSDADYNTWAAWQNQQANLRASEESDNNYEEPYLYTMKRVTTSRGMLSTALDHTSAVKRSKRSSVANATTNRSMIRQNLVTSELQPRRYVNPAYTPPDALTIHNPFVRPKASVGTPDWAALYVPCEYGTKTLAEAMKESRAPVSAEKLYTKLLADWF